MNVSLRAVLDTNVVLAARRSVHPESPNAEIIVRWKAGEFVCLCSHDIAVEYAEKMLEHGVAEADIRQFLAALRVLAE
jgi:predicted nucleic acid-binding protein